jgi:deazaflavin-dependent oxidoreductase (nitroreductase family)
MDKTTWVESIPHPSGLLKWLLKSPILLYRLGLGFIVGHLFMVMTTTGRKSGQPRRTAIEFHEFRGRCYVFGNWGSKADWYRNIEADPHITIQTWRGAESVIARRITSDAELVEAFQFALSNPTMRMVLKSIDFDLTLEQFLARREQLTFVTFDPTEWPSPQPIKADLWWVWLPLAMLCGLLTWLIRSF